jgi:hypothetical protein
LKVSKFDNVAKIEGLTDFSFQTHFAIFLNFQQQNPLKNQYLPHLGSEKL